MTARETRELKLFRYAYIALLILLAAYLLPLALARDTELSDFSGSWLLNGETLADTAELAAGDFGGAVVLEKTLPEKIAYNERLCLTTSNARLAVSIDGVEVYSYDSPENLTGKGYGIAYHMINLSPDQAGKTVRIELASVFDNHRGGRIYKPQIGSGSAFLFHLAGHNLLALLLSVGTLFLGLMLLVLRPLLRKKELRQSLSALGVVAVIAGLWMTNDTGILRLLTGNVTLCRVLDHALLHLVDFPIALLINSVTREKKMHYLRLVFAFTVLDISAFLLLRFAFGLDMTWLTPIMAIYHVASFTVIAIMLISDRIYCREHQIENDQRLLYLGVAGMAMTIMMDIMIYFLGVRSMLGRGFCIRFGFALFIALVAIQTIRWWTQDRTSIDRERFVNRVLQYAVSANDPETNINAMLRYIGTELHANRTYIFEKQESGSWRGTYEWLAEGMEPHVEHIELPCDLMDHLYEVFKRQNRLIISDRKQCLELNPALYQILMENDVERLTAGPLETNGKLIGLFGVEDAPKESLPEIAEIIRLVSYVFAQLVLSREDQKKLVRYSYYDALTGCRNRRALQEFEKTRLDTARPYGTVVCDVNGLKQMNDELGHEAGDALLLDVAACLNKAFGEENVYRTGGDEFVAYSARDDAAAFDADVARLRALFAEKGRSAAVGAVFRAQGGADYEKAKMEADAMMYEDKRRHYQEHGDRRKRRE